MISTKTDTFSQQSEVAIVGAGPLGLELAVAFTRAGVSYIQFDANQIGHTFSWWPKNTYFFSTTERIEIAGVPIQNTQQQRTTGEEYLAYLRSIVEQFDLRVNTYEKITAITRDNDGFILTSQTRGIEKTYFVKYVVLAHGDMHQPNLLNIPGENLPHVSHYFQDVHTYFRQKLLIIGGRNSAVETALRCWRAGAQVSISYRREKFDPKAVKHWLLPDIETQINLGTIGFYPSTVPVEITSEQVVLENLASGDKHNINADFVLLLTGYRADMTLFESAGVTLEGEDLIPTYNPETMETNVPGLYIIGTAAAGKRQSRYKFFIENTHHHVARVFHNITGNWPERVGTIPSRQYELPLSAIEAN